MLKQKGILVVLVVAVIGGLGLLIPRLFSRFPQAGVAIGSLPLPNFSTDQQATDVVSQLEQNYSGWQEQLDPCPCTQAEAEQDFYFVNATHIRTGELQPGAMAEYRTAKEWIYPYPSQSESGLSPLMPGQQCTYDVEGNLITDGAGAGTPDAYSPEVTTAGQLADSRNSHLYWDLDPLEDATMTWEQYHETWRPDNGNACTANQVPATDDEANSNSTPAIEMSIGESVTSTLAENALWWFEGKAGQGVHILVESENDSFDAQIALRSPLGTQIGSTFPNKRTVLPVDGIYAIAVGTARSLFLPRSGESVERYTLTLNEQEIPLLMLGEPVESSTAENHLWQFAGKVGQKIIVEMQNVDKNVDPKIDLLDPRGTTLASEGGYLLGPNPRLEAELVEAGLYTIIVSSIAKDSRFTLTLTEEPLSILALSQPVESTVEEKSLWLIEGKANDIIDLTFEPLNNGFDSRLMIYGPDGALLMDTQPFWAGEPLTIRTDLPVEGSYLVQIHAGGFGMTYPYRLRLGPVSEADLQLDTLINQLTAEVEQGDPALVQSTIEQIAELVADRSEPIDIETGSQICLIGAVYDRAKAVAQGVCTQIVTAADELSMPEDPQTIGIAHLANALAQGRIGNGDAALRSLQIVVESLGPGQPQFQEWITRLEAGEDPAQVFDDEMIEALKKDFGF